MKKHPYRCLYCGRIIGSPIAHKCNGNMRYSNLRFRKEDGSGTLEMEKSWKKEWETAALKTEGGTP